MSMNSVTLRQAGAADWPAIEALLRANRLPTEGAHEHLSTFLLAHAGGELVGCAGAEVHGAVALLRSVAVAPGLQRQGLGRLLVQTLLDQARRRDILTVYLLTETAEAYFAQLGFQAQARSAMPQALQGSALWRGVCAEQAVLMKLPLQVPQAAPSDLDTLPIAVLGAGPVGLSAAAQLLARGLPFVVLEAGATVGAHLLDHGHVRLFSPWRYNVDATMAAQLEATGWQRPPQDALPTAAEVVHLLLQPFAALPSVAPHLRLGARVLAVSREGFDKVKSQGRQLAPFVVRYRQNGLEQQLRARAVIDATGTWSQPNPLGASGLPAIGEAELADRIFYGIPDVLGAHRDRYAGRCTLVVGAGHSAANALLDLATLAEQAPATRLSWAVRSAVLQRVFGGGAADALPARGALGTALRQLRDSGRMDFISGLRITALQRDTSGQITVQGMDPDGQPIQLSGIDEIVCATGQRPNLGMTRELRLRLDPWLESTEALGPLIDPNLHSCGSVRPHGHRELSHPEPGFYTVGVKSYGRAPTFLMATGHEQVRSVVAALAGDLVAADQVALDLPETGVCSVDSGLTSQTCCGPTDVARASSCGTAPAASSCASPAAAPPAKPAAVACCAQPAAPARASRCCA